MGKGEVREKELDVESEYSSAEDSQDERSSGSSSPSSSEAGPDHDGKRAPSPEADSYDDRDRSPSPEKVFGEDRDRSPSAKRGSDEYRDPLPSHPEGSEELAEYEPMKLQMMGAPFSPDLLRDEDNELWLVRIPRYDAFVKALDDREIQVMDETGRGGKQKRGITSKLKGYYVFRDNGDVAKSERAVFVTRGHDGREKLEIAKPFARSIQVTFDAPLENQSEKSPPARRYPVAPTGLTLKYKPIGSETGKLPEFLQTFDATVDPALFEPDAKLPTPHTSLCSASAPKAPNGSILFGSPTRKRKLSGKSTSETSEPTTPELKKASVFASPSKKRRHLYRGAGEKSTPLTPEQESPSGRRIVTTPEGKSPSQQGSLSLNGKNSPRQRTQKSPRRKNSESRRQLKKELT